MTIVAIIEAVAAGLAAGGVVYGSTGNVVASIIAGLTTAAGKLAPTQIVGTK